MNPLTQIKNTQKISRQEILQGVPESASWHARYKHSAYVYAGGLPFDLTEGDVLTVFAQYGELVDVHNVKDRGTGKYRGFSFLAYEDQRSTVLAVDNLNGATVGGRTVRVEHVDNYKKKKAEVEGKEESESDEEHEETAAVEDTAAPELNAVAPAAVPQALGPGVGRDMPWAASGSIFSMLNDQSASTSLPLKHQSQAKDKSHKRAKEKKDKKHKRQKQSPESEAVSSGARTDRDGHERYIDPISHRAREPSNALGRDSEAGNHIYSARSHHTKPPFRHDGGDGSEYARAGDHGRHAGHHRQHSNRAGDRHVP
ncbi:hypothetical protein ABBQ32_004533 [Trebouxia sp. C0010 RCD-2024]